jgi:nicotinamidase/pyrazinamidase
VILEKNTLDVFDNPNADVLLGQLSPAGLPAFDPDVEFVVFGVVTEYCVRLTVDALLRRGRRVAVVTDAVQSLVSAKGAQILKELQSRGARLLTTEQVVAALGHYHFGSSSREAPSLQRKLA